MFKARAFLRRRKSASSTEDATGRQTTMSVEASAMSFAEGSQYRPFEAVARKRQAAAIQQQSQLRGNSTTGASDSTPERDRAFSITQSMTKKWFGVDEVNENMEFFPSSSSGTRIQTWLEHQQQSPLQPEASFNADARSSLHTQPPTTSREAAPKLMV